MSSKVAILATLLAGLGCSHATPTKDETGKLADNHAEQSERQHVGNPSQQAAPKSVTKPVEDVSLYFAFDSFQLDEDARVTLQSIARQASTGTRAGRGEGNCDERGTTEYNLALGDRRARIAAEYLHRLGVAEDKIESLSYGSERPKEPEHDETAWTKNRRDDVLIR